VYVQFREEEHAANAVKNLTGRFYAGLLSLFFVVLVLFSVLISRLNQMLIIDEY
jgi:hypothetical protein